MEGALACLSTDKVVYGLTLENSNVRAEPVSGSCRMGRTPRGRLVRVTGVYAEDEAEPLSSLKNVDGDASYTLGYEEDIYPIFNQNCNSCHGAVAQINELQVTDYGALLKGSVNGPVIEPGDAQNSRLWEMVSTGKMPLIGQLSDEEKSIIEAWINAGARGSAPASPDCPSYGWRSIPKMWIWQPTRLVMKRWPTRKRWSMAACCNS
ncbi:MAG: hypothetical protein H6645_00350 [Caldilineaceae bacterium]|nr:hypothetical protein [Caldilineaceae bacterium]